MSKYPNWWDKTLTIYNKYENPITFVTTWNRHYVSGCFIKRGLTAVMSGSVVVDTDLVTCRIPEQNDFVDPNTWVGTPIDLLTDKFTLNVGDIIVFGECTDIINEYVSGQHSSDLLTKYKKVQGCIEIKSVSINTYTDMLTPHYKVVGK